MFGSLIGAIAGPLVGGLLGAATGRGAADSPAQMQPLYPLTGGRGSDQVYDAFMSALRQAASLPISRGAAAYRLGNIGYGGLRLPLYSKTAAGLDQAAAAALTNEANAARGLLNSLLGARSYTGAQSGWMGPTAAGIAQGVSNIDWSTLFESNNPTQNQAPPPGADIYKPPAWPDWQ